MYLINFMNENYYNPRNLKLTIMTILEVGNVNMFTQFLLGKSFKINEINNVIKELNNIMTSYDTFHEEIKKLLIFQFKKCRKKKNIVPIHPEFEWMQ